MVPFKNTASNSKGTGVGVVLKSPQGNIIPQVASCEFKKTNNEVEYELLILGLQIAQYHGVANLLVRFNSLLITNQFNGSYTIKRESLAS